MPASNGHCIPPNSKPSPARTNQPRPAFTARPIIDRSASSANSKALSTLTTSGYCRDKTAETRCRTANSLFPVDLALSLSPRLNFDPNLGCNRSGMPCQASRSRGRTVSGKTKTVQPLQRSLSAGPAAGIGQGLEQPRC